MTGTPRTRIDTAQTDALHALAELGQGAVREPGIPREVGRQPEADRGRPRQDGGDRGSGSGDPAERRRASRCAAPGDSGGCARSSRSGRRDRPARHGRTDRSGGGHRTRGADRTGRSHGCRPALPELPVPPERRDRLDPSVRLASLLRRSTSTPTFPRALGSSMSARPNLCPMRPALSILLAFVLAALDPVRLPARRRAGWLAGDRPLRHRRSGARRLLRSLGAVQVARALIRRQPPAGTRSPTSTRFDVQPGTRALELESLRRQARRHLARPGRRRGRAGREPLLPGQPPPGSCSASARPTTRRSSSTPAPARCRRRSTTCNRSPLTSWATRRAGPAITTAPATARGSAATRRSRRPCARRSTPAPSACALSTRRQRAGRAELRAAPDCRGLRSSRRVVPERAAASAAWLAGSGAARVPTSTSAAVRGRLHRGRLRR